MSGNGSTSLTEQLTPAWQRGFSARDEGGPDHDWSATWGFESFEQPFTWFILRGYENGDYFEDRFELLRRSERQNWAWDALPLR